VIHDGMPYMNLAKVKVKVTEVRNLRNKPISKFLSSAGMHVIKRLMVNYDTTRHLSKF